MTYPTFTFRDESGHTPDTCPWCDECAEKARKMQNTAEQLAALLNELSCVVWRQGVVLVNGLSTPERLVRVVCDNSESDPVWSVQIEK